MNLYIDINLLIQYVQYSVSWFREYMLELVSNQKEEEFEEIPHWQLWNNACVQTHMDYKKLGMMESIANHPLTYRI